MTRVIDLQAQRRHLYKMSEPKTWMYGITTVPSRIATTLPSTLASLADAGFDQPLLFVDGGNASDYASLGIETVIRSTPAGAYANWALGMAELFFRNPSAQRYAMFEDDILISTNVRQYLDKLQLKDDTYWNLFEHPTICPQRYINKSLHPPGFIESKEQLCLGALALVFSNAALRKLLADPEFFERAVFKTNGQDGVVGRCMARAKIKEIVHHPSLVQHMGRDSIIGKNRYPYEETLALSFMSRRFDCLTLLNTSEQK